MQGRKFAVGGALFFSLTVFVEILSANRKTELPEFRAPEDSVIGQLRLAKEKAQHPQEITKVLVENMLGVLRRMDAAENGRASEPMAITVAEVEKAICHIEQRLRREKKCVARTRLWYLLRHTKEAFSQFKDRANRPALTEK